MKILLGPYRKDEQWNTSAGDIAYFRAPFDMSLPYGEGGKYIVWKKIGRAGTWTHVNLGRGEPGSFPSLEEAQQSLDSDLRELYNAIFLTEEQFEKLSVLL